jgi:uncharacterized protein YjaZ
MGVVQTYKWFEKDQFNKRDILKKLLHYFHFPTVKELYNHLQKNGMADLDDDFKERILLLKEAGVWKELQNEYVKIKKEWNGPEIPIFIFPCVSVKRFLRSQTFHRGGVAFDNGICIFLSPLEGIQQHKAVLIHEYNHVVRLKRLYQNKQVTLLDAMILEGLAENAVKEMVGEQYQAPWTTFYSSEKCQLYYKYYLEKHLDITHEEELYQPLLFGLRSYPNLMGYCVGYDIVNECIKTKNWSSKQLISISSQLIKDHAISYLANN